MNRSMRWSGLLLAAMVTLPTGAWARGLDVEISTDRGDDGVYDSGDKIEIKARASDDAYLLVYDIDAEGNVRLLFPTGHRRGYVEGGRATGFPPMTPTPISSFRVRSVRVTSWRSRRSSRSAICRAI